LFKIRFVRKNQGDVSNSDLDDTSSFTGDNLFCGFEIEGDRFFDRVMYYFSPEIQKGFTE
jgi:hypothetical protein